MRRLKNIYFTFVFIIILSLSLIPVLTTVPIDNEYVLIVYYEGENIKPGDSVTIKAELYKAGKRLDKPDNIQIDLYLNIPPPYNQHMTMIYEYEGIYTSNVEVPQYYGFSILLVSANAVINEVHVTGNMLLFQLHKIIIL